jgi:Tol biopolymer transport system component
MNRHRVHVMVTLAALMLTAGCSADGGASGSADSTPMADQASDGLVANEPCEPLPHLPAGRIAYTQTRADDSTALYLMKPDGSDRRCLIDTNGPDSFPSWSPDGRRLAFVGEAGGVEQVFVIRADGTGLRQVTESSPSIKESLEWSPDGRRIGYSASVSPDSGPFSIHVVDVDGSRDTTIAATDLPDVEYVELHDWSPDGKTLLYAADGGAGTGMWTMSPDGRDKTPLRDGPGDFGGGAVYSPDGDSLVFQADLDGGCIYRTDAHARHMVRLTEGCSEGFALDWSPDGRWIVWAGGPHGPADAEIMAADGTQRHTIVDDSSVAYTAWQPRPH